jgi:hypothetical protein
LPTIKTTIAAIKIKINRLVSKKAIHFAFKKLRFSLCLSAILNAVISEDMPLVAAKMARTKPKDRISGLGLLMIS